MDLPFKISTLVFLRNSAGELLLMRRAKAPNLGLWSCIGGKLEMGQGEAPHETARREVREEIGLELAPGDLHLFAMISEKAYEGRIHWLMFLFDVQRPIPALPPDIPEGTFAFHRPEDLAGLPMPATDRAALWPLWFERRDRFTVLRADCTPGVPLEVVVEESL